MTDLSSIKLIDLVPANIAGDDQVANIAAALDPDLQTINAAIPSIEILANIDQLPEPILKMLAWENRVYFREWQLAQTIEAKRDLVKNSFELNQRRGTRWAVERVLDLVEITATVQEWFEYGGAPYHFSVNIYQIQDRGLSAEEFDTALNLIDQYKPLRSLLESIDATLDAEQVNIYASVVNTISGVLDVYSYTAETLEESVTAIAGVGRTMALTLDVYPDSTP